MLIRLTAAGVVASFAVAACAASTEGRPPESSPPPLAATGTGAPGTVPASARPTIPANATVVYSAGTFLSDSKGKGRGRLRVFVSRVVEPSGRSETSVKYERYGDCVSEPVGDGSSLVNCPVLWTKRYRVSESALTIDPLLGAAAFSDTVQSLPLRIEWTASGPPRTQVNSNGNRFSEFREAVATGQWGRWVHEDAPGVRSTRLSRRVPER